MKLLDTNIVMFAAGGPHPLKADCRAILSAASTSGEYQVAVEVFQELLYVYHRRGQRARGLELVEDLQVLFPLALPTTPGVITRACRLMEHIEHLRPRDALHAAQVFEHDLEGIVSDDPDFDAVPALRRFRPDGRRANG